MTAVADYDVIMCADAVSSPEHTWGMDVKKYLHDEGNWTNAEFHALQFTASNYKQIAGVGGLHFMPA